MNTTIAYAETTENGVKNPSVKLNPSVTPTVSVAAFLNGRIFIKAINPFESPSGGNHIPLKTDCPVIRIEETPPTVFTLNTVPNKTPNPIKSVAFRSETAIPAKTKTEAKP